nr:retrovirus-related Pol polyprotein from transposon TNT 1-94 [Tanacetum cinerariifolium]
MHTKELILTLQDHGTILNLDSIAPIITSKAVHGSLTQEHLITSLLTRVIFNRSDYGGPEEIILGDGSGLHISHLGHTSFKYKSCSFKLNNILCVPSLKKKLISVAQFTKTNNVSLEFFPFHFLVKDLSTGAPLLRGENHNDLYCLPPLDSPQVHSVTSNNRERPIPDHSTFTAVTSKSSPFNPNQVHHTCNMSHGITLETFTNILTYHGSKTSPRPHLKPSDLNSNTIMFNCVVLQSLLYLDTKPFLQSHRSEPSSIQEPEQLSQATEPEPSTSLHLNNDMHTSELIQTSDSATSDQPESSSENHLQSRPVWQRKQNTKYYGPKFVNHTTIAHPLPVELEPSCVTQALKHKEWRDAMSEEFDALFQNHTWDLVPRTSQNLLGNKWVFRVKRLPDGSIQKFKARLVAKGFHQHQGIDYTETFSLVTKPVTIRVILCLALSKNWPLHQLDINNAFLNGTLHEEVYMAQPVGFVHPQYPNHVCKLRKALYSLKQAPRSWYIELKGFLVSSGFTNSAADMQLHDRFALKDLGELH